MWNETDSLECLKIVCFKINLETLVFSDILTVQNDVLTKENVLRVIISCRYTFLITINNVIFIKLTLCFWLTFRNCILLIKLKSALCITGLKIYDFKVCAFRPLRCYQHCCSSVCVLVQQTSLKPVICLGRLVGFMTDILHVCVSFY